MKKKSKKVKEEVTLMDEVEKTLRENPSLENWAMGNGNAEEWRIRDIIGDQYQGDPLLFMDPEEFDEAIIGIAEGYGFGPTIAYDYDKVIEINMRDGGTIEDAEEYFDYNQSGAYVGKYTPIFIKKIKGEIQ